MGALEDRAVGAQDHAAAGLVDAGLLLPGPPVGQLEVVGEGVLALEDRRCHDEAPALASDVLHRRLPAVQVVGGRRQVDLDPLLVEGRARQRHVVLPAQQAGHPGPPGLDGAQPGPVAVAVDGALVVGGHQLAVLAEERAVGAEVGDRVVEGAGRLLRALGDRQGEGGLGLAGGLADRAQVLGQAQAVARQPGVQGLVVVVLEGGVVGPVGVPGHEGLGEGDQVGLGQLADLLGGLRQAGLGVQDDRFGLDGGDGQLAHDGGRARGVLAVRGGRTGRCQTATSSRPLRSRSGCGPRPGSRPVRRGRPARSRAGPARPRGRPSARACA
jgi:hypothetical protein